MLANQPMGLAKRKTLFAVTFAIMLLVGCSADQEQTGWTTDPTAPTDRPADRNAPILAASDRLGQIIFGEPAAVAKPQIPSHWSLAEADSRY